MRPRFRRLPSGRKERRRSFENFVYARGIREAEGKIVIAPEAQPAIRRKKARRGRRSTKREMGRRSKKLSSLTKK
jgi:hypothetical protein